MVTTPETRYTRTDGRFVAFQVFGDAGPDVLYVPTATFPIDLMWDEPTFARGLRRLAGFSRLVTCDLLGVGSSDAVAVHDLPAMQTWTDGIGSVLDAAGSECAAVFATSESALPAMLYAATNPTRVRALVLWAPYASFLRSPEQPFGMPEPAMQRYVTNFRDSLGSGATTDLLAPSRAQDPAFRRWWARSERLAAGPGYFGAILELFLRTDVRSVLGSIQAPTLVLHRRDDPHLRQGPARAVVDAIPDARLVELPGADNAWFSGDADDAIEHIETFLTGRRAGAPTSRVLSTVLFTDIVGSTERAAAVGDDAWTATLEAHYQLVQQHVESFRGVVVNSTGDGVLATFDGPARGVECARSIRDAVHALGLRIRAGLHTGEVEVVGDDVAGIAVHLAARILSLAQADEVLVSEAVPPLVLGSGLRFADRGKHALKGVPDEWRVFAVVEDAPPD
jgi:class 3 adenylate cyclase/pimeloyl-ACP methyl ester carboxylesterase